MRIESATQDAGRAAGMLRRRPVQLGLMLLIVATGAWVRMLNLDERPLWVDEAESSINAMTVLQHGYPTDSYLGIPIFENTHVWPWPGNPEYEFRDVSYSQNHLAVYHGWLPLYAIAASFALHDIGPDEDNGTRSTKHDLNEQKRRTRAARLPSVLFAIIFLVTVFLGAETMYGREAAWAALITAAYYPVHISFSDQARYYSAQVALTTVCSVLLWLLIKECRWKHVWLAGVAFVLLFHTHLLSFFTAAVMAALSTPVIIHRQRDWLKKLSVFAAVVAAGTLPWILATGLLEHRVRIPRAWPLFRFPSDLAHYPPFNMGYAVPGMIVLAFGLWAYLSRRRVSLDVSIPAVRLGPILLFLGTWTLVGYVVFLLCIPAVSFAKARLNLSYWGPLFLLSSIMSAVLARMLAPRLPERFQPILTSLLMLLIFLGTGHSLNIINTPGAGTWRFYASIYDHLDSMRLDSMAKLYAAPNSHLVLTFYSGLPVQDITPVRKSYLDSYPGDIVYIDPGVEVETDVLDAEQVREAALRSGLTLTQDAAEETAVRLRTRPYRESMLAAMGQGTSSSLEPLPAYARELLALHRARVAEYFSGFDYELVTRGFEIRDWSDWSSVLKYRFVNPQARRGIHTNFVDRLRGADAIILARAGSVAIYRSRWHPPHSTESLTFQFVR